MHAHAPALFQRQGLKVLAGRAVTLIESLPKPPSTSQSSCRFSKAQAEPCVTCKGAHSCGAEAMGTLQVVAEDAKACPSHPELQCEELRDGSRPYLLGGAQRHILSGCEAWPHPPQDTV